MIQIGILSDTHLSGTTKSFQKVAREVFKDCSTIIHAGDLTDVSILSVFKNKDVHGVSGNMCNSVTRQVLPQEKCLVIGGYLFCACHGADGPRYNIEERMYEKFAEADCIIYGHTHAPACHKIGTTLIMNPGSFQATGRYGSTGTYGIITIDDGLNGSIHEIPRSLF